MSETLKLAGYYGAGTIDGSSVLITSGSVTTTRNVSYLEMVALPKTGMAGRVIHADGTESYEATIGFELYTGSTGILSASGLLSRGRSHTFSMSDGYNGVKGTNCYVTSASFSASSGSIISGNVSFTCKDKFSFGNAANDWKGEETPMGYWISGGNGKIASWSLSMSQNAEPMYGNEDKVEPHYIKIGLVSYELTVDSYERIKTDTETDSDASINIGTGEVTLKGSITGTGYDFGGTGNLGTYKYVFGTGSNTGKSNTLVIS